MWAPGRGAASSGVCNSLSVCFQSTEVTEELPSCLLLTVCRGQPFAEKLSERCGPLRLSPTLVQSRMGGLSPVRQRPLIPFASSGIQAPQSSPPKPAPAPSPTHPPPARALARLLSSPTPICPVSPKHPSWLHWPWSRAGEQDMRDLRSPSCVPCAPWRATSGPSAGTRSPVLRSPPGSRACTEASTWVCWLHLDFLFSIGCKLNRLNSVVGEYARGCLQVAQDCGAEALDLWTLMQKDGQVQWCARSQGGPGAGGRMGGPLPCWDGVDAGGPGEAPGEPAVVAPGLAMFSPCIQQLASCSGKPSDRSWHIVKQMNTKWLDGVGKYCC